MTNRSAMFDLKFLFALPTFCWLLASARKLPDIYWNSTNQMWVFCVFFCFLNFYFFNITNFPIRPYLLKLAKYNHEILRFFLKNFVFWSKNRNFLLGPPRWSKFHTKMKRKMSINQFCNFFFVSAQCESDNITSFVLKMKFSRLNMQKSMMFFLD